MKDNRRDLIKKNGSVTVPTMAGDSNSFPGYSAIGTLFAIGGYESAY